MDKSSYNLRINSFGQELLRRIDEDYSLHFIVKQNMKSDINHLTKQFLED
jgi:hypothetical protein